MPNARIKNTVVNARVGFNGPNVRVSSFQSGILTPATVTTGAPIGSPIGLLLALTYTTDMGTTTDAIYRGDTRPNVRIMSV